MNRLFLQLCHSNRNPIIPPQSPKSYNYHPNSPIPTPIQEFFAQGSHFININKTTHFPLISITFLQWEQSPMLLKHQLNLSSPTLTAALCEMRRQLFSLSRVLQRRPHPPPSLATEITRPPLPIKLPLVFLHFSPMGSPSRDNHNLKVSCCDW